MQIVELRSKAIEKLYPKRKLKTRRQRKKEWQLVSKRLNRSYVELTDRLVSQAATTWQAEGVTAWHARHYR